MQFSSGAADWKVLKPVQIQQKTILKIYLQYNI